MCVHSLLMSKTNTAHTDDQHVPPAPPVVIADPLSNSNKVKLVRSVYGVDPVKAPTLEEALERVQSGLASSVVAVDGDWLLEVRPVNRPDPVSAATVATGLSASAVSASAFQGAPPLALAAGAPFAAALPFGLFLPADARASHALARALRKRRRDLPDPTPEAPESIRNALSAFLARAPSVRSTAFRSGPKPHPAWRRIHLEIAALERGRQTSPSLRALGEMLEARGLLPPEGGKWSAASVKRAKDYGPHEAQILLRRIGPLLSHLITTYNDDGVDEDEFWDVAPVFGVHPNWLLDHPQGQPSDEARPVLERQENGKLKPTSFGAMIVLAWAVVEFRYDNAQFLWRLNREAPFTHEAIDRLSVQDELVPDVDPEGEVDTLAQTIGTADWMIKNEKVVPDRVMPGLYRLNEAEALLAVHFGAVADPDPQRRFDFAFWPTFTPNHPWDWEDDPRSLQPAAETTAAL